MIVTLLSISTCALAGLAFFFWTKMNALQYSKNAMLHMFSVQDNEVTRLNEKLSELRKELQEATDSAGPKPEAQADKPSKPKRKYYRKPKGPKTQP